MVIKVYTVNDKKLISGSTLYIVSLLDNIVGSPKEGFEVELLRTNDEDEADQMVADITIAFSVDRFIIDTVRD